MPVYHDREFLILPPVITLLTAAEDDVDRMVAEQDQARAIQYVLRYCDGVLVGGTTGHGPALISRQFETLLRISLEIKKSRFPDRRILVGTIETSDGRVKEKIHRSIAIEKEVGISIDGFVVPPQAFFYQQSRTELYRSMTGICEYAQKFGKVVYLYNIPRAGLVLKPDDVETLKKIPNVKGIKDSSGDYTLFEQFLKFQEKGFGVYQGKPEFNLKVLDQGGRGIVDANGNFVPSLIREMADRFFAGAREEASRIHERVLNSTKFLNQKDPWIEEVRLASRQCQLYLLGVIDILPRPLTESGLRHIGEGLIRNEIPRAVVSGGEIKASAQFTAEDLEKRLGQLYSLGYARTPDGRFVPKGGWMD